MSIYIYKIGLAMIRDKKLLLCEPYAFPDLILPGGIKEGDETASENLTREVREELGEAARLDITSLRYLGNFTARAAGRTERIVEVELHLGSVSGHLVASSEIKRLVWLDPLAPVEEIVSDVVREKVVPFLISNRYFDGGK